MLVCIDSDQLDSLQLAVTNQQTQISNLIATLDLLQRHINERVPLLSCVAACTTPDLLYSNLLSNVLTVVTDTTNAVVSENSDSTAATTVLDDKLDSCGIPELV